MTRLLIADDHPFVVSGIQAALADSGYEVVAVAGDGDAALTAIAAVRPDILVLDVQMPGRDGVDVLRTLRGRGDSRPVVLLTASIQDGALLEAIGLGVNGIVFKEGGRKVLLQCLDSVRKGGRWIEQPLLHRALDLAMADGHQREQSAALTRRERAVAGLVACGRRNRDIAAELGMTEGTVKNYLHRIYEKLQIKNRTELAVYAKDRKI